MSQEVAELNIDDFRSIFIQTEIGEIGITETEEGVRFSLDGETTVIKFAGNNSFTMKKDK